MFVHSAVMVGQGKHIRRVCIPKHCCPDNPIIQQTIEIWKNFLLIIDVSLRFMLSLEWVKLDISSSDSILIYRLCYLR